MLTATYKIEVLRDGKVRKVVSGKAHSFVKGLIGLLFRQAAQSNFTLKDIDGNDRSASYNDRQLQAASRGGESVESFSGGVVEAYQLGVVVGTGTNAVSPTDYKLQSQVVHGDGASELLHYGTMCQDPSVSGSDASFKISRLFENKSGSSITINEIGIYAMGAGWYSHCIARDVLSTGVTVNNNEILKVEYTIKVTV